MAPCVALYLQTAASVVFTPESEMGRSAGCCTRCRLRAPSLKFSTRLPQYLGSKIIKLLRRMPEGSRVGDLTAYGTQEGSTAPWYWNSRNLPAYLALKVFKRFSSARDGVRPKSSA